MEINKEQQADKTERVLIAARYVGATIDTIANGRHDGICFTLNELMKFVDIIKTGMDK